LKKIDSKLVEQVKKRRQELTNLCQELIQAKGENPPGDVHEAASVIERFLEREGINRERFEPQKGHVSVLGRVGEGKPALILCGHIDVVPAGDASKWASPPYSGDLTEGKILGRGASDMKGGVAAMLMALAVVKDFEADLPGVVTVASVCDEEAQGPGGAIWLLENKKLRGDACLITEPTGYLEDGSKGNYSIVAGEKGTCWLLITASGEPAHGSLPPLGRNAILNLTGFLPRLKALESSAVKVPKDAVALIRNGRKELLSVAKKRGVPVASLTRALDHYTINVGTIAGGTKANVVPEKCEAEIDIRVPAGGNPDGVEELVRSVLPEDFDYRVTNRTMPSYTPADNPLIKTVQRGAQPVFGYKPAATYMAATSDAHFFREMLGVPTVAFGPGYGECCHAYDEFVYAKDVIDMAKVYAVVIANSLSA